MNFDFDNLNSVLDLAGEAGTATSQIGKAVETVKGLFKRPETATDAEIKTALSELTVQIANAKMANADLKLQLAAFKEAFAQEQAFQAELERYELWETPTGSIVHRLKEAASGNEPMHYLCPTCVEDKRKSILQGHSGYRKCTTCDAGYQLERPAPIQRARTGRRGLDW